MDGREIMLIGGPKDGEKIWIRDDQSRITFRDGPELPPEPVSARLPDDPPPKDGPLYVDHYYLRDLRNPHYFRYS